LLAPEITPEQGWQLRRGPESFCRDEVVENPFARQLAYPIDFNFVPMAISDVAWSTNIGLACGEDSVALLVGVGAEAEPDFADVVHDHIVVHHHEVFGAHVLWSMPPRPCAH